MPAFQPSAEALAYGQKEAANATQNAGNLYQQIKYTSNVLDHAGVDYSNLNQNQILSLGHAYDYENAQRAKQGIAPAADAAPGLSYNDPKYGAAPTGSYDANGTYTPTNQAAVDYAQKAGQTNVAPLDVNGKPQLSTASVPNTPAAPTFGATDMVTVTSPSGETRQVTGSQAQGFLNSGWKAGNVTPMSTNQVVPNQSSSSDKSSVRTATNTVKGYDTNNNYAEVWVPAGKYVPGVSATPKGITVDSMQSVSNVNLSGTMGTGESGKIADSVASIAAKTAIDDIKATQDLYKQTQTPEQKQAADLSAQVSELIGGEKGKTAFTNEQTAKLVDPIQAQLTGVNNQINALMAEKEKYRIDQEGKPTTLSSISGAIAQNNAKLNGEILTLTAQANALMGNITLAQKQVQNAVDAKYGPNEEAIAIAQAQLAALKPTLDGQDKIQADAIAAQHTAALQAIADQKTKEKELQTENLNALNEYVKAGGKDQSVISQIQGNKVSGGALALASNQISTNANLDTQLKQAQLSKTKAEAAKAWADTSQNTPETPPVDKNSQSILAQTGITSTIFNYLTQGTAALSRMTAAGRKQVQDAADAFLNKNGLDYSTFQSRYKAYNDVLQKNLERANNTSIYANEVSGTVDQFIQDFKPEDVKQGGWFGLGSNRLSAQNVLDLAAGKQVNNPLATKYSFDIKTMANDLAGYLAASRGSNVPENSDLNSAAAIISNGINTGSAEAFKKSIQDNEQKVTGVVNNAVESANRNVWGLFGVADNYKPIISGADTHNGITLPGATNFSGINLPH